MNGLVGLAVRRPVSTLMAVAALVLIGTVACLNIAVSNLPDVRPPRLVVSTTWPGLPAVEVRQLLTKPLEDALAGLKGLKSMESLSRMGVSVITIDCHWGTDLNLAGVELRELIDSAWSILPEGAAKPLVLPVDPADEALMVIGLVPRHGDLALTRRLAEREIRTRLQQVPGIGSVVIAGGSLDEIKVEVDRPALAARNLSLDELAQALSAQNYDYPAGVLREGDRELAVKTTGSVGDLAALSALWIRDFRLGAIATLSQEPALPKSAFSLDGVPAVGLYIHRQAMANPLAAAQGIRRELERLGLSYGQELEFHLVWDGSQFMSQSLRSLGLDALIGVGAAFVVLLIFLGELRSSLIIMSAIPLAILTALAGLALLGRSLNLMSIAGLTLGIGMMIDNSVVIVEHLERRLGHSATRPSAQAVIAAGSELSMSNMASSVTSIIVFVPILFLPGLIGAVFADLAITVIFAQIASWLVSVTVVPVLFLILPRPQRKRPRQAAGWLARAESGWQRMIGVFVRKPIVLWVMVGGMAMLAVVCLWCLPREFLPLTDNGVIEVELAMAQGQTIERSARIMMDIEKRLMGLDGVAQVFSRTGGEDDDLYYQADPQARDGLAMLRVVLSTGSRPPASRVAAAVQAIFADLAAQGTLGARVSLPANPAAKLLGMSASGSRLVLQADTLEALQLRRQEAESWMASHQLVDGWSFEPAGMRQELSFTPDRMALAHRQAGLDQVAASLRGGSDGLVATRIVTAGRQIPVRLLLSKRQTDEDLGRFPLRAGDQLVEVRSLGSFASQEHPSAFYRQNRQDAWLLLGPETSALAMPEWFENPQAEETAAQLQWLLLVILLILALLYLFLGAQLQSFVLPALLMSSIPLALGGIFAALLIAGLSINLDSLLGIIVLLGVVINSAVVLYETYEAQSSRPPLARVLRGTRLRIRAILITSSITVVSLLPMAFNLGGSNSQSSLTVAVIGGLVASTILTLFVVPALFLWRFRRIRHA